MGLLFISSFCDIMPKSTSGLIYVLACIIAIGPLSVDLYLPAMPAMQQFFATDISQIQLTLSSYLLGFSIFHLFCGPLSDRFGRKPILLLAMGLYVVMSVFCAMATTIEELIFYRFFQAMGACCAPTLGRAIVRDIYDGDEAVKSLAYVSSLMAIAPIVAPCMGGVMILYFDWSITFYFLAVAGFIAFLMTLFLVPESLQEKQTLQLSNIIKNYLRLCRSRHFIGHVLTASCLYSCAFAFLSGSSFILIDFMNVPAEYFGLYFLLIVGGYITGNLLTAKIAFSWPVPRLYYLGMLLSSSGGLAMVLFSLLEWYVPILYVAPVFLNTFAIGLVLPKAMGEALQPFANMAGTASAFMGFLQMGVASLAGWLVGYFLQSSPMPMALVMSAGGVLAWLCYYFLLRIQYLR